MTQHPKQFKLNPIQPAHLPTLGALSHHGVLFVCWITSFFMGKELDMGLAFDLWVKLAH
uniref:Uncharacterized protein n=1 Tax=Rhizophora mucronata TaxID=61149 RepID=A0A2P2NZZ4_RHIMU